MQVETLRKRFQFVPGQSGNPAGRAKGSLNKKANAPDYSSSERGAIKLADLLREYWYLRHVMIKVWVVPVFGYLDDGAKVIACYGVRSNIAQVMEAKGRGISITR